ncbi:hypothetical protein [Streptomyces sp. NRRL S-337]|nr:hypothetical protein [Streptomyces sp. NRRL S-337]
MDERSRSVPGVCPQEFFLWYVSTWKGNKIKWTSDEKMLRTS